MKNKILFYTNASHEIGFGHVNRVCNLIKLLNTQNYQAKLLLIGSIPINYDLAIEVISLKSNQEVIQNIEEYKPELIVLDLLETEKNYQLLNFLMPIRLGYKIMVIDCFYNEIIRPECIIAPWGIHSKYENTLSGLDYLFFDPETINKSKKRIQKSSIKNILITLGGADKNRVTSLIANEIATNFPDKNLQVVIGPLFSDDVMNKILKYQLPNVYCYNNLTCLDELYMSADLAIIGGGQTKFEAALFGLPALIIANTDKEVEFSTLYEKLRTSIFISDSISLRCDKIINKINPNKIIINHNTTYKNINACIDIICDNHMIIIGFNMYCETICEKLLYSYILKKNNMDMTNIIFYNPINGEEYNLNITNIDLINYKKIFY